MLPILTPLVLGIVGYEYIKYSRNNEQIGRLLNQVTYSQFRTIKDVYEKFGASEGYSLLKIIYDSIISFDKSLVPTYYHHINPLKLSAIIPAAVVDYDPKGFIDALMSSYFISEPYHELTKAFNRIKAYYINKDIVKEPKPLKFISVEEAFKPVTLKFETELYNGELFSKLSCPQDSYFKYYTCHGSRSPQQENPVSDSHKWIVKVPNVDEKTNVWWFQKGSDKIDLREFYTSCEDLQVVESEHRKQLISMKDQSTGKEHKLEITFKEYLQQPSCADFIFSKDSEKNSEAMKPLERATEEYNGELFTKLSCTQDSYLKHYIKYYICQGSRSPYQENPVSDSHKWIVKVPNVDEKTHAWWFQKGSDKIDLREFGVECNDLAFSEVRNYGYAYGHKVSITNPLGQKHELEVTFKNPLLHPTCEDFIFNAE